MEFNTQLPEWKNEGTEPSDNLKSNGFREGYKPPAGIFNWFWSLILKAIKEIQESLSNVNNTSDSEKSVKYASEAGIGRKLKNALTVRFNGGDTESTDKWTFDGSTSRSINITPEKIGARPTEKPNIVVNAIRGETDDGKEIYTATDSNITELYNGLEITIIPNEKNTTLSPRLDINGLGDKAIRLALSFNCAATNALKANFFSEGRPITLKYHSELNLGTQGQGAWIFADRLKVSAQDLYGSVPISSGGTGASTAEDALTNLGIVDYVVETGGHSLLEYRFWNSGKAEMFGSFDTSSSQQAQQVGGWYATGHTVDVSKLTQINCFLGSANENCVITYDGQHEVGAHKLIVYKLLSPQDMTNKSVTVSVYIVGKWK